MKILSGLILLFCVTLCWADQNNYVLVETQNGDIFKAEALFKEVELNTKYGKLKVPLEDITKVQFRTFYTKDISEKIDSAIKALSEQSHKKREFATESLIKIGKLAYFKLKETILPDLESNKRKDDILNRIQASSKEDLIEQKEDLIENDTLLKGKIVGESFKFRHELLGEVNFGCEHLRYISMVRNAHYSFNLEAKDNLWVKTNITLKKSDAFRIQAEGSVDLFPDTPGQYMSTPKGYTSAGTGSSFMAGSLIGRIGNGEPFYIGENYFLNGREGNLELKIVNAPWNNQSLGSYQVKVRN